MPLSILTTTAIVAEVVRPGFSADLSTWIFSVDSAGAAVQQVRLSTVENRFRAEKKIFTVLIPQAEVSRILSFAADRGFSSLEDFYSAEIDDAQTRALAFRCENALKRVEACGAGLLEYKGSTEMKLFMDLWRLVEPFLPYGGA